MINNNKYEIVKYLTTVIIVFAVHLFFDFSCHSISLWSLCHFNAIFKKSFSKLIPSIYIQVYISKYK